MFPKKDGVHRGQGRILGGSAFPGSELGCSSGDESRQKVSRTCDLQKTAARWIPDFGRCRCVRSVNVSGVQVSRERVDVVP